MAGYEEKKWQNNVLYPYQQMMGQAGQLSGTANQMISGGIGQVANAGAAYMQSKAIQAPVTDAENSLGLGVKKAPIWAGTPQPVVGENAYYNS